MERILTFCFVALALGQNVHIIFSNHLDVGFNGPPFSKYYPAFSVNVVNYYLHNIYPNLLVTIDQLAAKGIHYVYTTHAWMVYLYLHCQPDLIPPVGNYYLECPKNVSVQKFRQAIANGHITWTAIPSNTHVEMQNSVILQLQLDFVQKLNKEFGLPNKLVVSQRDVPGLTAGAMPIFLRNGIKAISVGGNIMAALPAVPKIFRWQHPSNEKIDIVTMFSSSGYGSFEKEDAISLPGCHDILVFDWNADNVGSGSANDVLDTISYVQKQFPDARVFPSTFENFILAINTSCIAKLPVVKAEIGDTWIHGIQSDPYKIRKFRQIARFLEKNPPNLEDPIVFSAIFRLVKVPEHTFGLDETSFLGDENNWNNKKFNLIKNSTLYQNMATSWMEQRKYLEFFPKNSTFLQKLDKKLRKMDDFRLFDGSAIPINQQQACGHWNITFGTDGDITYLASRSGKVIFQGQNSIIFSHQTLDNDDFDQFLDAYCRSLICPDWFMEAFGKEGLFYAKTAKGIFKPKTVSIKRNRCIYTVTSQPMHNIYGPPKLVQIIVDLTDIHTIKITLVLSNKTASRMPEAYWFTFQPVIHTPWFVHKVDTWIPVDNVVENGGMHQHGTYEGLCTPGLSIKSLDAGVVSVGVKNPFPTPFLRANTTHGFHFLLYNNIFGTNYPSWYPFTNKEPNLVYRFQIKIQD